MARVRAWGVWSGCRQRSGLRLMHCLVQLPVMAAPSLLRCHFGFEPPPQFVARRPPCSWQLSLHCGAATRGKWRWGVSLAQAGVHTGLVMGSQSASSAVSVCPLCPALGASKHSRTPCQQSPGFPQPSNQPRRLVFLLLDPRAGHPIRGSNFSLPREGVCPRKSPFSSESPPTGRGLHLITSLPFPPEESMWLFLTDLGCTGVFLPVSS